jgi:hypothetical protein
VAFSGATRKATHVLLGFAFIVADVGAMEHRSKLQIENLRHIAEAQRDTTVNRLLL